MRRERRGLDNGTGWINDYVAHSLFRRKYSLPVMLNVYAAGTANTSELIRSVHGHPKSVIIAIRELEVLGVLSRVRVSHGRHPVETRLTVRGMQLIETPLYRWDRLIRKWDLASD